MRNGMSKTAFLIFAMIIAFGILSTVALAIITTKPIGVIVTGFLIFGLLTVGLMIMLTEKDFKLDDDFKLTIVRVRKFTLPDGISEDEVDVEEDEIYVEEDDNFKEVK